MKMKAVLIIFAMVLLLSSIFIIGYFTLPSKQVSLDTNVEYVQAPVFGWFSCEPATRQIISNPVSITMYQGSKDGITCPANTDKCSITINGEETNTLARRLLYTYCSLPGLSSCSAEQAIPVGTGRWFAKEGKYHYTFSDQFQPGGAHAYVKYQYCSGVNIGGSCVGLGWKDLPDKAEWYASFNPFIIWFQSSLTGKHEYTNLVQGCTFPSSTTSAVDGTTIPAGSSDKLINSVTDLKYNTDKVNPKTDASTAPVTLEPYKVRNVIVGYVPMATENVQFVTWNGKSGYCINKQVYSIATITTKSGKTLKVVDVNWNNKLADLVSQGKQCCPGDSEPGNNRKCGTDFMWHPIEVYECDYLQPCEGTDWYPSGTPHILQLYTCNYNTHKCEKKTKQVECTTNNDCIGNPKGGICDTLLWECSSISPPVPNGTCPDSCTKDLDCFNCYDKKNKCISGKCAINDSKPSGCSSCFSWLWAKLTTNTAKKCSPATVWQYDTWLGKLFGIKITQNEWCPIFLIMIGSGVLVVLLIVFMILLIFYLKRRRKK